MNFIQQKRNALLLLVLSFFITACTPRSLVHNPRGLAESSLATIHPMTHSILQKIEKRNEDLFSSGVIAIMDDQGERIEVAKYNTKKRALIEPFTLAPGKYTFHTRCLVDRRVATPIFSAQVKSGKQYSLECFGIGTSKNLFGRTQVAKASARLVETK